MAGPKRLTLFVEGEGDRAAVPVLVRRVLGGMNPPPWDAVFLDNQDPYKVDELTQFVPCRRDTPPDFTNWHRSLQTAYRTRKNLGAVLLLLDGDANQFEGQNFCPGRVARRLTQEAVADGAGALFSVAVVFAVQEFESWLLAGFNSLSRRLPDAALPADVQQPRDAKGVLKKVLRDGYKPTLHQAELANEVDIDLIRNANLRSFRRLENALQLLVSACRAGSHVISPSLPSPPSPQVG